MFDVVESRGAPVGDGSYAHVRAVAGLLEASRPVSMAVLLRMATIRRCAEVVVAPGPDPRPLSGRAAVQPKLSTYADLQKRS
jgi:hypothetical protein